MIIYCESDGRVSTIPSTIPFGSALREITIIAPQTNASVALKIKPPNGVYQHDIICNPELDADGMLIYTARLPKTIATTAGRAEYQVAFSMPNGEQVPSFVGSFNITRGVLVDMPSTVEELSAYSIDELYALLSNLTTINLKIASIEDLVGVGKELDTVSKNIIDAINEINAGGGGGGGGGTSLLTVNITEGGTLTAEEFAQIKESPKSFILQLQTSSADYILRYESNDYSTIKYRTIAINNGIAEQYICTLNKSDGTYSVTKTMHGVEADATLTKAGYPADAAKVGEEIQTLKQADVSLSSRVSNTENDIAALEIAAGNHDTQIGELDYTATNLENRVTALENSGGSGGSGSNIVIDATLTQSGQAADAQATGNRFLEAENRIGTNASDISSVKEKNTSQDTKIANLEATAADIPGIKNDISALQTSVGNINVAGAITTHNADATAHNDIRKAVEAVEEALTNFLDVDDTTKDQLSELLEMIANNETDIETITSKMVKVTDIVTSLNVADDTKPLSASAGMTLNQAINALSEAVNGYVARIEALERITSGASSILNPSTTCAEASAAFDEYRNKGKRLYWQIGIIDEVVEDNALIGYNVANKELFFLSSTYKLIITVNFSGVSSEAVSVTESVLGGDIDSSIYDAISRNESNIESLQQQIDDINYKPISISGFRASTGTYEKGATVTALTFSWSTNKTPKTLTFAGTAIENTATSHRLTGLSLTSGKSWTLTATDDRDASTSATASINFYNGVYYGAAAAPSSIDSAFILSLSKELRSSYKPSFTVDSGEGQYIWYCLPVSMGKRTFAINGFTGGFALIPDLNGNEYHIFTNAQGHTENYYVYRTDFAALGSARSVTVS